MNGTLEKIKKTIVDPAIQNLRNTVVGHICSVDQQSRHCTLVFIDKDGSVRTKRNMALPPDGDGVFRKTIQPGDKVELAYRNQNIDSMYISTVYPKFASKNDFKLEKGQHLPQSTELW